MRTVLVATALFLLFGTASTLAQNPSVESTPPQSTDTVRIPAGTELVLELTETLSSRSSRTGDSFGLRVVEPLVLGGRAIVPIGALGRGEVIDAGPSQMAGRPGKLVIGARELYVGDQEIPIRGMTLAIAGTNNIQEATESVRPHLNLYPHSHMSVFTHGGEVEVPAGTRGRAQVIADIDIPSVPIAAVVQNERSTATSFLPSPEPDTGPALGPDQAEIIFFRPRLSTGGAYTYHVVETSDGGRATRDSPTIASLRNNSYAVYEAEPGVHTFNVTGPMTLNRVEDRLRIEVEGGQKYYIVLDFRSGVFTAGFVLLPSDSARFALEEFSLEPN